MSNLLETLRKTLQAYQKHILVFDKDGIFFHSEVQTEAQEVGFKLIFIEDAYKFRISFELNHNLNGRILYITNCTFPVLPDIIREVKTITVSFRDFFPLFDSNALSGLSFSILSTLSGYKIYDSLGYNDTIKFILENIYNLDFDAIKSGNSKERLLNALITVYLEKESVNKPITDFLLKQTEPFFPELYETGLSKKSILDFVKIKWQNWVNENEEEIDFNEFYLTKTIGHLFIKGLIQQLMVTKDKYDALPVKVGVYYDINQSRRDELKSIVEYLSNLIPNIEDKPQEWFEIIQVISRAKLMTFDCEDKELLHQFKNTEIRINERFQLFVELSYNSLTTRSGIKHPFLVTRILEYIRYQTNKRKALIVIDGLSYWQWLMISEAFQSSSQVIEQKASFAFIPTITAWSRQAIFKGELPDLNENNSKEQRDFESYWKSLGYKDHEIGYYRMGVNSPADESEVTGKSILGIVINDLDDIMHGTLMGDEQLYLSTKQWMDSGLLVNMVVKLKQEGFKVFLTTDHGNIEAEGIKSLKMNEKFGALSRSKRHIRFSNETLKNDFLSRNSNLPLGIDGLSVYLKNNSAFEPENKRLVTHGGSHFWEVIIPFIEI